MSYIEKNLFTSSLNFTLTLLLPKYPRTLFPVLSSFYFAKYYRRNRLRKLKLQLLPEDAFSCCIPENIQTLVAGNTHSLILVGYNTLSYLDLCNCSWLKLRNYCLNYPFLGAQPCYLVQIIAVPDIEDSVAIVTNVLHFNIKQTLSLADDVIYIDKKDRLDLFQPKIACRVKVCLVQSSQDIKNKILDEALNEYFNNPRFLQIGDVFCVDVVKYAPSILYQNSKLKSFNLRVVDIEGPHCDILNNANVGYYVLKEFTSLIQCSSQQGYIPRNDMMFIKENQDLRGKNFKMQVLSTCPTGLEKYRDELLACLQPFVSTENRHQLEPLFLLCGPHGTGKKDVVKNVTEILGLNMHIVDSYDLQGGSPGYTEGRLKQVFSKIRQITPCILLLQNIEVLCKDQNEVEDIRIINTFLEEVKKLFQDIKKYPVLLVATSNDKTGKTSGVSPLLARAFLHVISMQYPDNIQRTEILQWLVRKCGISVSADLSHIAAQTSGFVYSDLSALLFHAIRNQYKRLKSSVCAEEDFADKAVNKNDFYEALDTMHAAYSDAIDAPKIPKVLWDDIGGLADLKEEILRTIMRPIQHPELLAAGLRRSGLLLYGPPGTGKTLLAKAVATECSLNFLSVKGPELLNMYVGQSEENIREVFSKARAASPCIIFFDELDSLAPNRGRSGDSGGVMDRVVSQLLAEMDGLQKSSHLFVIGATNRPDLIDPALLRPGRFDKLLYVGISEDRESQLSILLALTRRFQLESDAKMEDIVLLLPDKLTGADLYSICSQAWMNAVRSRICNSVNDGGIESSEIKVGKHDFLEAVNSFTPSVSKEDLQYFEQIRNKV